MIEIFVTSEPRNSGCAIEAMPVVGAAEGDAVVGDAVVGDAVGALVGVAVLSLQQSPPLIAQHAKGAPLQSHASHALVGDTLGDAVGALVGAAVVGDALGDGVSPS